MDADHPYRPPHADVGGPPVGFARTDATSITPGMLEALRKTRPWVMLMGIITLLGCGLMLMFGLGVMVIGAASQVFGPEVGPLGVVGIGVVYLILGLLYLVPGIHLLRYAGAIKGMGADPSATAVEQALRRQLAFWRFVGIMMLAVLVAYALIIVVAMLVAGIGAIGATMG